MSDNMDCLQINDNCFICDRPIIDVFNMGAWNNMGDICCKECWKREQEEWEWITGDGAA